MQGILEDYLYDYFKYDTFQPGQKEIIMDVMAKKDVLGVLPTGSGKSLCYQLPAKILPGITVVVSPLISLMIDQVRQVKAYYYKEVVAIHSFLTWHEKRNILDNMEDYKLVFISPELIQQHDIKEKLMAIHISLFVIDEAHCISQWGYDFRPDYLRLQDISNTFLHIPILALTATASDTVQKDIIHTLQRENMRKHIYPIERKNIAFIVEEIRDNEIEKREHLEFYIRKINGPTLIYFLSRKTAEEIALYLHDVLEDKNIVYYHAGMSNEERLRVQQQFIHDQIDIVCCTSAFGMGINKANIRLVIHYHLPTQMESFIQEVGRAGRDGLESISMLLYRKQDNYIPFSIIKNELPQRAEIEVILRKLLQMAIQGRNLPPQTEQIVDMFQITEVKWRVLLYHLQIYGLVKGNRLVPDGDKWHQIKKELIEFCKNRLQEKQRKLYQMIHWAEGEECLYLGLYQSFQQNIIGIENNCCSNCHFSLEEWENKNSFKKQKKMPISNWQHKLRYILFSEENDIEAK